MEILVNQNDPSGGEWTESALESRSPALVQIAEATGHMTGSLGLDMSTETRRTIQLEFEAVGGFARLQDLVG